MEWIKTFVKQITSLGSRDQLAWDAPSGSAGQGLAHIDSVVYPAPGTQYHGIRPDGAYVPMVFIDGRGEPCLADEYLAACEEETERLRAAGHAVAV